MRGSRTGSWTAALLAASGLALAVAAVAAGEARAQLADPPLGWDMWDPGWKRRDSWRPERMGQRRAERPQVHLSAFHAFMEIGLHQLHDQPAALAVDVLMGEDGVEDDVGEDVDGGGDVLVEDLHVEADGLLAGAGVDVGADGVSFAGGVAPAL